jgi:hypothetical protein
MVAVLYNMALETYKGKIWPLRFSETTEYAYVTTVI